MGLVPPAEGFLELLRACADESGALLIFDEVISGFRVARGGAQELSGVIPDLTVMGKVIGGGLPAAAYGGSRALMERIAPAGDVYQAGTLSGNPLAVAAGRATLALLDGEQPYASLAATTHALADGLAERGALGRPRRAGRQHDRAAHGLLQRRAGDGLRRRPRLRPRRLRRLVSRPARARRLRAGVAVRGLVSLARAHARADRAARSPRPPRRSGTSSDERGGRDHPPARGGARQRQPARRHHGRVAGGLRRRRRPRSRRAGRLRPARRRQPRGRRARGHRRARGLPAALRRAAGHWRSPTPTWRCSPATGSTRSASRSSPRSATSPRSPSSPTSSRSARRPTPPATPSSRSPRGTPGRRRSAGARTRR